MWFDLASSSLGWGGTAGLAGADVGGESAVVQAPDVATGGAGSSGAGWLDTGGFDTGAEGAPGPGASGWTPPPASGPTGGAAEAAGGAGAGTSTGPGAGWGDPGWGGGRFGVSGFDAGGEAAVPRAQAPAAQPQPQPAPPSPAPFASPEGETASAGGGRWAADAAMAGVDDRADAGRGGGTAVAGAGEASSFGATAPPPLDPNRPFAVDERYDAALARVERTPAPTGGARTPILPEPEGAYRDGPGKLVRRIAAARPEDEAQLRQDIREVYMQPGAVATGNRLQTALTDALDAGDDTAYRQEVLNGIASIAKVDPLRLAAEDMGAAGLVLGGVTATPGKLAGVAEAGAAKGAATAAGETAVETGGPLGAGPTAGVNYQKIISQVPGKIVAEADAINPGTLSKDFAETFSGGRYATIQVDRPVVLYRAWTPGQSNEFGAFWSLEKPVGSLQARIDSALLPEWGNVAGTPFRAQASQYTAIEVPAGTTLQVGEVGSQVGAWVGGKSQVLIPMRAQPGWKIGEGKLQ